MDPRYAFGLWGAVLGCGAGLGSWLVALSRQDPIVEVPQETEPPSEASTSLVDVSGTNLLPQPTLELSPESISIASFNIQVFGKTKASKPAILAKLAEGIRKHRVVAVQEIKQQDETAAVQLLEAVNAGGANYALSLSPRTGRQPDDAKSQEQYAFYYDTAALDIAGARLFDDTSDRFQREPYLARFTVRNGGFNFVLMTIHTRPESAVEEIGALHQVFEWAIEQYPGEDDFISVGDYNAGCDYATPAQLDTLQVRGPLYTWVVPDDADTNLSPTRACPYDRLIFRNGTLGDFTGEWGVDADFSDQAISDHWPIWAKFYAHRDGEVAPTREPLAPKSCCRVCKATSQPCGDTCIAAKHTCRAPMGCACQGASP